jgi:ATP synthase F1 complex assembly factor 1
MLAAGRRYPTFVLPLNRGKAVDAPAESDADAYEFFILQWAQHEAPPVPTHESETALFPTSVSTWTGPPNPPSSTVIYAPLGEYKLRQEFAAPHLVLTFYTELARTHGIVLLRGELTPTGTLDVEGNTKYWLSQADAQILTMGLQRFYLWQGKDSDAREKLLTAFHERPAEFKWEDLLQYAKPI